MLSVHSSQEQSPGCERRYSSLSEATRISSDQDAESRMEGQPREKPDTGSETSSGWLHVEQSGGRLAEASNAASEACASAATAVRSRCCGAEEISKRAGCVWPLLMSCGADSPDLPRSHSCICG